MNPRIAISIIATFFAFTANAEDHPSNELPMFGGAHPPLTEQNKKFRQAAADLGWKYFYKGDIDTAIKRFNQAWMFDTNSATAYWGFGLITGRRAEKAKTYEDSVRQINESIRFLSKALELDDKNPRIMVDLAVSYTGFGSFEQTAKKNDGSVLFLQADELFKSAHQIAPDYPLLWSNWAYLKYYQGQFELAEKYLGTAKKMKVEISAGFEKDLLAAKTNQTVTQQSDATKK